MVFRLCKRIFFVALFLISSSCAPSLGERGIADAADDSTHDGNVDKGTKGSKNRKECQAPQTPTVSVTDASKNPSKHVQESWEFAFFNALPELDHNDALEGWMLLAYSGWSFPDQIFVLSEGHNRSAPRLFLAREKGYLVKEGKMGQDDDLPMPCRNSGLRDPLNFYMSKHDWLFYERPVQPNQAPSLISALEGVGALNNLNKVVMDGTQWEFIYFKKTQNHVSIDQRIYINTPMADKDPIHDQAIRKLVVLLRTMYPIKNKN